MSDESAAETAAGRRRAGFGSLGAFLGVLVASWGAVLASFPLKDNSFLTHLATGRIILGTGSVPSSDPYTFTVPGIDWTVQSWLASVVYASAERLGGDVGLRLLVVFVFLVSTALLWRLTRSAESIVVRILLAVAALVVASDTWSERPYMIGVIGLAVLWFALEGSIRPWLLTPFLWVWANTHGSFPYALALVISVLLGTLIDQRRSVPTGETVRYSVATELAVLKFTVVGVILAVIGPLGPRVLTFPVKGLTRSDVLADIVEWKAPSFTSLTQRVFLLLVLLAVAALTKTGRWRHALPVIGFVALSLVAQRNIVMALMILVPVIAAAAPTIGTLTARDRPRTGPLYTTVALALLVAIVVTSMSGSVTDLEPYPERAVAWLSAADPDGSAGNRAAPDFVGNLYEALDGPTGMVFVDDRADMYPTEFFHQTRALARAEPSWSTALDEYEIQVLVWPRSSPVTSLIAEDLRWQVVFADLDSIVACRRGTGCAALNR